LAAQFKPTFSHRCKLHFVGLWDTVSSIGWIYDPVTLPFTYANPDIEIGRHAISIDERRCAFRQNLWSPKKIDGQDIRQLWFPGVHSDVGGGYPEAESGLAKISLQWMIQEARAVGLRIDPAKEAKILGQQNLGCTGPDPTAPIHQSLEGLWKLLELVPRSYMDMRTEPPKKKWHIPLCRPRLIEPTAEFHASTFARMKKLRDYRPINVIAVRSDWEGMAADSTTQ
jgi:uncharacterized protein (DUF2235 family)